MKESGWSRNLRAALLELGGDCLRVEDTLGGFPDIVCSRFRGPLEGTTFMIETKAPQTYAPWSEVQAPLSGDDGVALRKRLGMRPTQWNLFRTWRGEHYVACAGYEAGQQSGWWVYRAVQDSNVTRLCGVARRTERLTTQEAARFMFEGGKL